MASGVVVACAQCGQKNRVPYARLDRDQAPKCGKCGAGLRPLDTPVDLTQSGDFDAILAQAKVPVLVDFWAQWCGPCHSVAPELVKVAANARGGVMVLKVNTEAHPTIAGRLGIRSIPTMMVFKDGREAGRTSGARPAPAIEQFIQQSIR